LSFFEAFDSAKRAPNNPDAAASLAEMALKNQEEEKAVPMLRAVAERIEADPRLWQWLGLLHRALDEREQAIPCFEQAAALAPQDCSIAHGHARVVFEAGLPAVKLFENARRLSPDNGDVVLGHFAAQLAAGDGDRALAELDAIVAGNPLWLQGQRERIHLAWILGHGEKSFDAIKRALRNAPREQDLWQLGILGLTDAGLFDAALGSILDGRRQIGNNAFFDLNEAILLSELGRTADADRCFKVASSYDDPSAALHLLRHELRNNRVAEAVRRLDYWLDRQEMDSLWPYADIAWRLAGDERARWLDKSSSTIRVFDLADRIPNFERLVSLLRSLHLTRSEHLDQSVRGGTQTDGVLFSRIEPEIKALRQTIVEVVSDYIASLPEHDALHPTLSRRRDRKPRFSGSWSVRLQGKGFHANHVHPAGWISSALYLVLPERVEQDAPKAGWFKAGEPQAELGVGLAPTQIVEPKPGRLVLFPSTTWHGTIPFEAGERLTIAFDVAHPK
jgi:tetratricopeptide (TPR) repeat protein